MRIEIIKTGENDYSCRVDDMVADSLSTDEALGIVASVLFSDAPLYVRPYEQRVKRGECAKLIDRIAQKLLRLG